MRLYNEQDEPRLTVEQLALVTALPGDGQHYDEGLRVAQAFVQTLLFPTWLERDNHLDCIIPGSEITLIIRFTPFHSFELMVGEQ